VGTGRKTPYTTGMRQLTEETLRSGLEAVAGHCADTARALRAVGHPALRHRTPGFATLLRAIVGQQVSVASADAIWRRVEDGVRPVAPQVLLALDDPAMRALGLSRPKIRYARALAEHCTDGRLPIDQLQALADDEAVAALTAVKGIGRWTAEVYLLFALGRQDVLPADDLALLVATQHLCNLPERPTAQDLRARAEAWRPWRGAVAHLLWRYYSEAVKRNANPL